MEEIEEEIEDTKDVLKLKTFFIDWTDRWLNRVAQWREMKDELQSCFKSLKILFFKRNAIKYNIKHF